MRQSSSMASLDDRPLIPTGVARQFPHRHQLRVIAALFKKQWLIKVRRPSALVEFIGGSVVWLILLPVWLLSRVTWPGYLDPPLTYTPMIPQTLLEFFAVTEDPILVVAPNCTNTRALVQLIEATVAALTPFLPLFNLTNVTINPQFRDSVADVEALIDSRTSNGLGIFWRNAAEPNARISPIIELYTQVFIAPPAGDVLTLFSLWLLKDQNPNISLEWLSTQHFATPPSQQLFEVQVAFALFAVLPMILVTMPDLQSILDDKDSRVQTLTFLMGCGEAVYWGAIFLMQFMLSLVPYTTMPLAFTQWFGMKGSSFTLLFVMSLLFVIGQIWFQMFLTTFMKKASGGRVITVVLLVLTVFFGYLHRFFTMSENNESEAIKHVFSIVPISAYEMFIVTLYHQNQLSLPPVGWSDLNNDSLLYRPWYGLFWLTVDVIAYFLLFMVLNLVNKRDFGSPLLTWRELFSITAWRRVLRKALTLELDGESPIIEVKHLYKTYKGERDIVALSDVSCSIEAGEVIVIIGPNGAGKSTFMNILAGAIEPTSGSLRLSGGAETTRFCDIQEHLGVCFQENVLISLLSIREHFELFGRFRGLSSRRIRDASHFLMDTLQLLPMVDNRAGDLSGGQKRKLCISLSLLGNPRIVIMDEPTAGVDVQSRQLIWKTIAALKDTTVLVTSHALEEAEAVSSRLFVVSGGKIPFAGTSTQLRNDFNCGYILKVEGNVGGVLELAQQFVPAAKMQAGRSDTIELPVCKEIAVFTREFEVRRDELGVMSASFGVEQLEDVLLRLIENEEAGYDAHRPK